MLSSLYQFQTSCPRLPARLTVNKNGIGYCGYSGKQTDEKTTVSRGYVLGYAIFLEFFESFSHAVLPANDCRDSRLSFPFLSVLEQKLTTT
jgi:hypothetical protein